jgi:hypothetical protein
MKQAGDSVASKKIETKLFPPQVVTSRLTAMGSSSRQPFMGLGMASATTVNGRRNLRRTEQPAPLLRQSRALATIILMFICLNASKRSTYLMNSHVGFWQGVVVVVKPRFFTIKIVHGMAEEWGKSPLTHDEHWHHQVLAIYTPWAT